MNISIVSNNDKRNLMNIENALIERVILPSDLSSVSQAESLVDKVCNHLTIQEDIYGNVLIAITEAINNAIIHGNCFNKDLSIEILVSANQEDLNFTIKDEGSGFDYTNLPDPTAPENIEKENGRGIFLIKNLSDEIQFNDSGNEITITFKR
jgi:serine/threonine-protein kinase RsbW